MNSANESTIRTESISRYETISRYLVWELLLWISSQFSSKLHRSRANRFETTTMHDLHSTRRVTQWNCNESSENALHSKWFDKEKKNTKNKPTFVSFFRRLSIFHSKRFLCTVYLKSFYWVRRRRRGQHYSSSPFRIQFNS